jgi:predicted dienelactone hydrolase
LAGAKTEALIATVWYSVSADKGAAGGKVPVAMVVGQADTIAPAETNASKFHRLLPASQLTILPGGVAHYTFLDTCGVAGKTTLPVYCTDAAGVDRDQAHAKVAAMAVDFFDKNLR